MSNLPVDRELSHIEGETTLDKLSNLFKKRMDLFGIARDTSSEVTVAAGSAPVRGGRAIDRPSKTVTPFVSLLRQLYSTRDQWRESGTLV